jgi:hypothetical protein
MFLEESMLFILTEDEKDQVANENEPDETGEKTDETTVDGEDEGGDPESKTSDAKPVELNDQSFESIFNSDIVTMSTLFSKFTTVRNAIVNIKSSLDDIKQLPTLSSTCNVLFGELDELEQLITNVLTTGFELDKKDHYINLFIYVQGSIRIISKLFKEMEKQNQTQKS